jgi:hypothetical protein
MAWYFFSRAPPSKKVEPAVKLPREKTFRIDVLNRIEEEKPFSLVYIAVKEGDINYICQLVGGRSVTTKNIGIIVEPDAGHVVMEKLEQLASAPFSSDVRIGHAKYSPPEKVSLGELLVIAQNNGSYHEKRKYSGRIPVVVPVPEASYAVQ